MDTSKELFEDKFTGQEEYENEIVRKDGQKRIIKWKNTLVKDDLGNITGLLSSGEDVTDRRQNEERAKQQRLILKFLNSMAIPSADKSSVDEFSKNLLKAVKSYTGAVLATFSFYQSDKKELELLHIEAEQGILKTVLKIAGEKIAKTTSPVDDEQYRMIIKDMVARYNSFTEVSFGAIPTLIDKAIRASTGINRLYPIAHVIEGELYGTTMLAFKKGQTSPSIELLESYAHLMSVSLRRYKAEKALKESEHRFRFLAENAKDMIYRMSIPDGVYEYVSPASSEIFGYTPEEFYDTPLLIGKVIHPDWAEYLKTEWQNLIDGNISPYYEYQIIDKSGKAKWINQRNTLIRDEKGSQIAIEAVVTDVTESKQMEEALIKNQERYERAQAMGHVGNWEYNIVTTHFWGSDEAKRIYGFDMNDKDFTTEKIESCIPDRKRVHQALIDLIEHDKKYDLIFDIITQDKGDRKTIHSIASLDRDEKGNPVKISGVVSDITEQKKAEQALKESEEKTRMILDATVFPLAVADINEDQILYWSKSALNLFGHAVSNVDAWYELAYPDPVYREQMKERWKPMVEKALELEQSVNAGEYHITCKDGSVRICELYVGIVSENLIVTFNDITEKKLAGESLKENEEKYRLLHENAGLGIGYFSPEGTVISFNSVASKHMNGVPEDFVGKSISNLYPKALANTIFNRIQKVFKTGEISVYEDLVQLPDEEKWFLNTYTKIINSKREVLGFQIISQDITEQKLTEKALIDSNLMIERIINTIPVRVFWKDINLNYLGCNPVFARDAGYSDPSEIIGKNDYQMTWRDQAELYQRDDQIVIDSGKPKFLIEEPQTTPEGKTITLLTSKTPIFDSEGKVSGVLGTFIDITDRKNAEIELKKYKENLEELVAARTSELLEKNKELEHYNDLFHGREFRIKELRDQVKELKQQIADMQGESE